MLKSYLHQLSLFNYLTMAVLLTACGSEAVPPSNGSLINDAAHQEEVKPEKQSQQSFEELVTSYENVDRANWQNPKLIIHRMGDLTDKTVADIGAGTGYFTLRILPMAAKVIAIDIDPQMTDFIDDVKKTLEPKFRDKLESRLCTADDSKIKTNEADIILLSNTYAYIDNRVHYLKRLKSTLKPGGRLMIVDFKKKRIPVHDDPDNRIALYELEQELLAAGFEILASDDQSLPFQYIVEAR